MLYFYRCFSFISNIENLNYVEMQISKSHDHLNLDDVSLFQISHLEVMPIKPEDIAKPTQEGEEFRLIL